MLVLNYSSVIRVKVDVLECYLQARISLNTFLLEGGGEGSTIEKQLSNTSYSCQVYIRILTIYHTRKWRMYIPCFLKKILVKETEKM